MRNIYESPPGSGANDGALPVSYDPLWGAFDNLTPAQIVAFQSFPQDLIKYTMLQRWRAELSGTSVTFTPTGGPSPVTIPLRTDGDSKINIIGLRQAIDGGIISSASFFDANGLIHQVDAAGARAIHVSVLLFVQQTFTAAAQAVSGINSNSVTTRKQIDNLISQVAPNSPSATNPSIT